MGHDSDERTNTRGIEPSGPRGDDSITRLVDDAPSSAGHGDVAVYQAGQTIGRYVVLDRLGAGGMSVVYGAYDPDLDRKIAIKILLVDPDGGPAESGSRSREARLLREAQALAKLSHPHVLPVFDVGTFEGRVFIAMEYVDGVTLADWVKPEYGWREVLAHYVRAGRGLAAAHAAGLVHRDFKPHNVLVGKDGSVRVMDFGLVRLNEAQVETDRADDFAADVSTQSLLNREITMAGAVVGTVAYMAPEQHMGEPVDARADQYSFCVALYQGLYGVRPFADGTAHQMLVAKQTMTLQPLPANAIQRVPKRLGRVLLRGLQPDPRLRWTSMDALLDALAKDATRTWGRAVAGLAVAGMIGAATTSYLGGPGHGSRICSGGNDKFAAVWNDGVKGRIQGAFEMTKLPYVADAWSAVESAVDAYREDWTAMHKDACEATQVRREQSMTLMDLRMACLENRLWRVRALVGVFEEADARAVEHAAQAVRSLPSVDECGDFVALQSRGEINIAPEVESLRERLAEPRALIDAGMLQKGLAAILPLVDEARSLGDESVLAESLQLLGVVQSDIGNFPAAEDALTEAAWRADAAGADAIAAAVKTRLLMLVGYHLGRPAEAMVWGHGARGSLARSNADPSVEAEYFHSLAIVLSAQSRHGEAYESFKRSIQRLEEAFGPDHPALVRAYGRFAETMMVRGAVEDALRFATKAIDLGDRALGRKHIEVASPLMTRAEVLAREGRYDDALADADRAKTIVVASLGEAHALVGAADRKMAHVFICTDQFERARAVLDPRLGRNRRPSRRGDHVAPDLIMLGRLFEAQGKLGEAIASYEAAAALLEETDVVTSESSRAQGGLGRALVLAGRFAEALGPLQRSLSSEIDDRSSGDVALTQFALAEALWRTGSNRDRARELAVDALSRLSHEVREPCYSPWRAKVSNWLASIRP